MKRKIKILFVLPDLGGGGAERTVVNIVSNLDRDRFEPILVLCKMKGLYVDILPSDLKVIDLNVSHVTQALSKLIVLLRSLKPDILFSTLTHMNIIAILAKLLSLHNTKVIVREANTFSEVLRHSQNVKVKLLPYIIRYLYNRADKIVFLSKGSFADFRSIFNKIEVDKMVVIYNPVNIQHISDKKLEAIEESWNNGIRKIITVGRLTKQKGHEFLLKAFKIVIQEINDLNLVILGEGEEKENLIKLADVLGIGDKVKFLGFKANPYKYIAHSDVFVLSSLYEGFGNVILEAMACGVPVISTDCPYGPGEIIQDEINGLLVPPMDVHSMANAILKVLKDRELAARLRENGYERVKKFEVSKIIEEYSSLFERVADNVL